MDLDLGPHAITAVLERDTVRLRLVCPGAPLCKSYHGCSEECAYGHTYDDDDNEIECPGCHGLGHNGEICGLTDWFDNIAAEEMFDGCDVDLAGLTFPISIRVLYWHSDEGPCWDVVRPEEGVVDGAQLIAEERRRQVITEGWTVDHDDAHTNDELVRAAVVYLTFREGRPPWWAADAVPAIWPFEPEAWKASGEAGPNLVKAGALIAAELDRLQRAGWRP